MSANKSVNIKGLSAVEHRQADGTFVAYLPQNPVPTPVKAGDRLHVQLGVADNAWIYVVGAFRQNEYWKVGQWAPGANATNGSRDLWPGGHVLTADQARMTTLLVIASTEELPWAKGLTHADCSSLVGQMPSESPASPCDHLYGLFWKTPKRARGLAPPTVEWLTDGGIRLPALGSTNSASPFTVVEWLFKPRT